jgi:hypothetical protein
VVDAVWRIIAGKIFVLFNGLILFYYYMKSRMSETALPAAQNYVP